VNNTNNIKEWDFVDSYSGSIGSISSLNFKIGTSSRMVAYWTSTVFQDDSYALQEIQATSAGWEQVAMDVNGLNNSGLAIVPLAANNTFSGFSVLYDRDDGKLFDLQRNQSAGWVPGKLELWPGEFNY
jgi:hypothetical protein